MYYGNDVISKLHDFISLIPIKATLGDCFEPLVLQNDKLYILRICKLLRIGPVKQ